MFVVIVLVSVISVAITANLIQRLHVNAVLASAAPSLIVAVCALFFRDKVEPNVYRQILFVFFGASFVGMSASHYLRLGWHVVIGGVFFAGLFIVCQKVAEGFGGRLGLFACIAVFCTIGLEYLFTRLLSWLAPEKKDVED